MLFKNFVWYLFISLSCLSPETRLPFADSLRTESLELEQLPSPLHNNSERMVEAETLSFVFFLTVASYVAQAHSPHYSSMSSASQHKRCELTFFSDLPPPRIVFDT